MADRFSHPLHFLEYRRSPRYKTDRFIVIQFQNRRVTGLCTDYNEDGFGATIEHDLPVGEIVSVEFAIAGREPTPLQTRIIYRKYSKYGFEFVAPKGNLRRTIADFFRETLEGDY
jgi:hypothetical protein